ncbi:MAG: hypothetical protein KTR32_04160 [Granulosicoccus sp.]|nr:hypothetical protein [Granulosicoccus sp.]
MNFVDSATIPTLDSTGLIIAYVVIGAALLSLNLFSSWNWFVKTAMNIIVVGFFWVTYHSWPGILGWPTERDLPGQFYLHAINIDEPHRIYLWGTDIERGLGHGVPRAYSIRYNRKLHDRVDKVTRKLRKGLPVIGQVSNTTGAQQDLTTLEQTQTADTDIVFIDAPQGLIPGK